MTDHPLDLMWGDQVVRTSAHGHPVLAWEPRPSSVPALLPYLERWGDRLFVCQGDRRLSFADLARRVDPTAASLREHGATTGSHVVINAYSSPEWVLALLATWRLGAVPVIGNRW